jgi:hypothetical protein
MKELLEKAILLVSEIEAKLINLNGLIDKNRNKEDLLSKKEETLKEKEIDLSRRESKIKHIEDVSAIEASNIEKDKEIKKDMSVLNVERKAFVDYQEQVKAEHKAAASLIESKTKAADAKEAEYTKALKDLKEEKKKLKENILKEIGKNIKG